MIKAFDDKDYPNNSTNLLALRLVKNKSSILSCGCGSGREIKELLNKNCKIIGIDIDKQKVKDAKTLFPSLKIYKADMRFFRKPNHFDCIVCLWNTINNLNLKGKKQFVSNCYKNLKVGGKLIITSQDMFCSYRAFIKSFIGIYYYSPFQIKKWFEGTAFKVEVIKINKPDLKTNLIIGDKK